ncbi:hypothetical protein Nepgr_022950 [Nepenthes gracilis]|uniref:Uncharacterized protein n=1 Tax=Nepenthes gracilis TaxID=150966 RepID=A0AAD3SZY0_NEPGR|nr:hypothetical protein Nepgr_022950 [Nepenthes gracilis]
MQMASSALDIYSRHQQHRKEFSSSSMQSNAVPNGIPHPVQNCDRFKSKGLTIHQIPDSGPHIKPQTKFHQTAISGAANQHTEYTRIGGTPSGGSQHTTIAPNNPSSHQQRE